MLSMKKYILKVMKQAQGKKGTWKEYNLTKKVEVKCIMEHFMLGKTNIQGNASEKGGNYSSK